MFTRAFNVAGLIVRIAEWKACLLAFSARRSAIAMLGQLIAAIVALGGLAMLLGAGYVALEAIAGVSIAMAAVGVFLLLIASLIWVVANRRVKGTGQAITEHEVRKNATRDQEELRSLLGMTNNEAKPNLTRSGLSPLSESITGLDNPKVVMAAAFAMLGLLGPGRLFRTIRIATALGSIAALANRAINEHQDRAGHAKSGLTTQTTKAAEVARRRGS